MATAPMLMTIEQYLHTSYSPDVDFVDGHMEERNSGEKDHARLQALISAIFVFEEEHCGFESHSDVRILVSGNLVRICDFVLTDQVAPYEEVLRTPPLLCLEIMPPDDRLSRSIEVLEDYRAMGIPNIWLIDPNERLAYTFGEGGLHQQEDLILKGEQKGLRLDVGALFAKLERKFKENA